MARPLTQVTFRRSPESYSQINHRRETLSTELLNRATVYLRRILVSAVSAAGTEGALVPWKAWALLGGVILSLFAVTFLSQHAMARLRYLGTEPAAIEMARRLRADDGNSDVGCMFGLIPSPHRDAGLAEMNRLFGTPDFPISQTFLVTMAILPLDPAAAPETLRNNMETNVKELEERLMSVLPQNRRNGGEGGIRTHG